MAGISIKGIRLTNLAINTKPDNDDGMVTCQYELISSGDKVLAKQSLGGYGGMKLALSPATAKTLDAFLLAYKNDVNTMLGLDIES